MTKVLFISSLGGHLEQLLSLKTVIGSYESYIVTEKNDSTQKLRNIYDNLYLIPYVSRKNYFTFILTYLKIFRASLSIFFTVKPDVIVTTGAGCVIPMCLLGKICSKKIIFIETFSRINSKTLTGTLCYYFADVFIVQWKALLKKYPKALYLGPIF